MRSRDVIGKPVVSADGGQKIVAVSDLLLDHSHTHLAGLVIGNGWFTTEHVLLYENVQTIGPDAVLARTRDGIVDAGEWKKRGLQVTRTSVLKNRRVLTTGGNAIGTVRDVLVDEKTGDVEGYEIARASAGIFAKHVVVPRSDQVTIGQAAIIVSESVASSIESQTNHSKPAKHGAPE